MLKGLKNYLISLGLVKDDASDDEVKAAGTKAVADGSLTFEKMLELQSQPSDQSIVLERLGSIIGGAVKQAVDPLMARIDGLEKAQSESAKNADPLLLKATDLLNRLNPIEPKKEGDGGEVDPISVLSKGIENRGEGNPLSGNSGGPNVKKASDRYSASTSQAFYPEVDNRGHKHAFGGMPFKVFGRPVDLPSERQMAQAGAIMKRRLLKQMGKSHLLSEHDLQLSEEGVRELKFSGEWETPDGIYIYDGHKLSDFHTKTIFGTPGGDASGGENVIAQVLETELIRKALLFGEIAPYVDMRSINQGSNVDTPTFVNLTISSGTYESTSISAQSTSSLLSKLNSPFFAAVGAIKLGRDFISDSSVNVMQSINDSYAETLQKWLDEQIVLGDGTTEPLGIFNSSGATATTPISNASPSPTGWDVVDLENMVRAVGKQYRSNQSPSVRWLSNDTTYFRVRGIRLSTSDERRIFGLTHEDYRVLNRPWSVQNTMTNAQVAFGDLSKYRLWRRLGMEMRVSDQGQTLMLENSILVMLRSRWAGRLLIGEAFATMTSAPS